MRIPIRNSAAMDHEYFSSYLFLYVYLSGTGYASGTDISGKQKLWTEHCQISHLKYCIATAVCSSSHSSFYPQIAGVCSPLQSSCVPDHENFLLIRASLKWQLKGRQTNSWSKHRDCYIFEPYYNKKAYPGTYLYIYLNMLSKKVGEKTCRGKRLKFSV